MVITAVMDEEEMKEVDEFLSTVFMYDDEINGLLPYFITPLRDINSNIVGCEITINDDAVDFLVGYDHDCKMGSEDGCEYCQMLSMLDILPD